MNVATAFRPPTRASSRSGIPARFPKRFAAILEEMRREISRLRKQNQELRKKVSQGERELVDSERKSDLLERKSDALEKEIAERDKKITDLEHQLAARKKDSTNSSKPPSSDGPAAGKRVYPERKKSGRKPGGQKGHPGKHRALIPVELVNKIIPVTPDECEHCGFTFPAATYDLVTKGEPYRLQVTELPEIRAQVTEHQFPECVCPKCKKTTRTDVPDELRHRFGPKLTAFLAYLTVNCRMPRRKKEELLEIALGTSISLGSIQKAVEETSDAVEEPCRELEQQLRKEPVINGDETGWRNNGKKRWLWVFVAQYFVFFTVAQSRSSEVLIRILGATFAGILCTDRFSAYIKYHKGVAQFCWAHLKRDLLGAQQFARTTIADRFCRDALALHARMFRLWHRFRNGDIDRSQLILKSIPLEKQFFALGERHLDCADAEVRPIAAAFFWHVERLFTFIQEPGVEPTNNISERAIRTAVQWRKTSFGNRSEKGEKATARLLTASSTCRMQNKNILEFLTQAVQAHRENLPAPSLLPPKA